VQALVDSVQGRKSSEEQICSVAELPEIVEGLPAVELPGKRDWLQAAEDEVEMVGVGKPTESGEVFPI
jgi:hypothetical protein